MSLIKLNQEQSIIPPRCDKSSMYLDTLNILNVVHCDWQIVPLEKWSKDSIALRWQVATASVAIWDPVFFNKLLQKRDLPTGNRTPLWVRWGGWLVVLKWKLQSSWLSLTAGTFYFKNNTTWKLSTTSTDFKIWYANATDTLLVDLDVQWSNFSTVFSVEVVDPLLWRLYDFAYCQESDEILCSWFDATKIARFNAQTNQLMWSFASLWANPYWVWVRNKPWQSRFYSSNYTAANCTIFSVVGTTYTYLYTRSTSANSNRVAYSETSDKIYIGGNASWVITRLDCANADAVLNIWAWYGSYWICWNSEMNRIYANASNWYLHVIDCVTDTLMTSVYTWYWYASRCTYNPNNNCVYVACGSVIRVFDCASGAFTATVAIPWLSGSLYWISFFETNNFIYTSAYSDNFVAVIDCATNTWIKNIYSAQISPYSFDNPKGMLIKSVYDKVIINNDDPPSYANASVVFLSY